MFLNIRASVSLVAFGALVPLGCSSTSNSSASGPSRCINSQCDAAPSLSDAGREPAEASAHVDTGAPPAVCVTGAGVTTLYEGPATTFGVGSDRVAILGDSLLSVPLAGGAPTVLVTPSPQNLFVLGSTAYYGGTLGGGGLMAVPTSGGAPRVFMSPSPLPLVPPAETDGTSIYFTPFRAIGDVGGISRVTPPSTTVVALTAERFMAVSVGSQGDDVYFIAVDLGLTSSFIGRVPKRGGQVEHLVPDIGVPVRTLAVDDSGLYWIQPLSRWADGIHRGGPYAILHAGLDGSSVQQIYGDGVNSIVAAHGRLYFTTATEVDSVAATGGPVTTIASNQNAPTMLTIAGGNLVWMNGFQGAPDGGTIRPSGVDGSVPGLDASGQGTRDGSAFSEASVILGEGGGGPQPTRIVTACIPK